ncbi:MAG: hypothetical protein RIA71_03805 [Oceanicaulis sp.]
MSGYECGRFVHLLGGLRAFDVMAPEVEIGVDTLKCHVKFKRPQYANLFHAINSFNLKVIGCEFIDGQEEILEIQPRDWLLSHQSGWSIKFVQQEWSNISYKASQEGKLRLASVSERIRTYLRLIELRVKKISDAYHNTLRAHLYPGPVEKAPYIGMFGNQWLIEIDAAVHSFLADAGTLRDVLAEAIWIVLLQSDDQSVKTMASLIKRSKSSDNELIQSIINEAKTGWIKNLTDIRNHQIHVAPVSSFHEHTFCQAREITLRGGAKLIGLHYPFTTFDWRLRKRSELEVDYSSESKVKKSIKIYDEFANNSGDALEYCWMTANNMASFAESIRIASGLSAPIPTVKPNPGSIKIIRPRDEAN